MTFDHIDFNDESGISQSAYRNWKDGERAFNIYLDRDLRDCRVYAWLMGFDDEGYDAGMFELGPMEIVWWHWGEALGATGPWSK